MVFTCPIWCPAECCRFRNEEQCPTVTVDEARALAREASRRGLRLTFKVLGKVNGVELLRWVIKDWCPFFDKATRRCTIHDWKPLACRLFPLVLDPRTGRVYLSEECLWVRQNGPRSLDHFPNEERALKQLLRKLRIRGRVTGG